VRDVFENLLRLMQPTLEQKNIEFETILKDTDLVLEADTDLLEQILINLVVNAIEAVKDNPKPNIVLTAYLSNNRKPVIKVADNGEWHFRPKCWTKFSFLFSALKKVEVASG
jgi:C4-dicarboxylate-specific signal transduction histidine kinase